MAISGINLNGEYYSVLVNGKKISDIHRSTAGEFCINTNKILIFKLHDYYQVYDKLGKHLIDFHAPAVGKLFDATDRTIMFTNADRIDTYDLSGKKVCSRNISTPDNCKSN